MIPHIWLFFGMKSREYAMHCRFWPKQPNIGLQLIDHAQKPVRHIRDRGKGVLLAVRLAPNCQLLIVVEGACYYRPIYRQCCCISHEKSMIGNLISALP